jgi:hypothetical protein
MAQVLDQLTLNQRVADSSPATPTNIFNVLGADFIMIGAFG